MRPSTPIGMRAICVLSLLACTWAAPLLEALDGEQPVALAEVSEEAELGAEQGQSVASTTATGNLRGVVKVLTKMLTQLQQEEVDDKGASDKYRKWASHQELEKTSFISQQAGVASAASAVFHARKAQVTRLNLGLQQLSADIASTKRSLGQMSAMRRAEARQHEAELADYTRTVRAIARALVVLRSPTSKRSGKQLTQVNQAMQEALSLLASSSVSSSFEGEGLTGDGARKDSHVDASAALSSFLQSNEWQDARRAPTSRRLRKKSTGVLATLRNLRSTFETNRRLSIIKENDARRQYSAAKQTKNGEVVRMSTERNARLSLLAEGRAAMAEAVSAISQAQAALKDSRVFLTDLSLARRGFSADYVKRLKRRHGEIAATTTAVTALNAVRSAAIVPSFAQTRSSTVAVGASSQMNARTAATVSKLRRMGHQLGSTSLIQAASLISAAAAPRRLRDAAQPAFGPVKTLLRTLINRLAQEQADATSQSAWCTAEKRSSLTTKLRREVSLKGLQSQIEAWSTSAAALKQEARQLTTQVTALAAGASSAAKQRAARRAAFLTAKADHDEAIGAIQRALAALSMVSATPATALLSVGSSDGTGSTSEGATSAMRLLEDLQARYIRSRDALVVNEAAAQGHYVKLGAQNEKMRVNLSNTRQSKTSWRRQQLLRLHNAKAEYRMQFVQLRGISQYMIELKPGCDQMSSSAKAQRDRREAEMAALKEALAVLSDPSSA